MGSIPVGGTIFFAPVAQLDRVPGYELGGSGVRIPPGSPPFAICS